MLDDTHQNLTIDVRHQCLAMAARVVAMARTRRVSHVTLFGSSERRDRAVSSPLGNVESVWRDPPRALIFSKAMRFGPKESCKEMDLNWFSGGFTAQSCEHGTACPCHFA